MASTTLYMQQLRSLVNVEGLQPSDSLVLDFMHAINHVENSLQDLKTCKRRIWTLVSFGISMRMESNVHTLAPSTVSIGVGTKGVIYFMCHTIVTRMKRT